MFRDVRFRTFVAAPLAFALVVSSVACSKKDGGAAAASSEMAPKSAAPAAAPDGADSPQAVVDRMKKAGETKDMKEVVACLSPNARKEMASALYLGATMMVAFSQMGAQMGGAMMDGMSGMAEGMGGKVSDEDKKKADEQMAAAKKDLEKLATDYNAVMQKYGLPTLPKEGEEQPDLTKEQMEAALAKIDHKAFVVETMALLDSMPGAKKNEEENPFAMKDGTVQDLKIEGDSATGTVGGDTVRFVKVDGRWYLDADPMGGMEGGPGGEKQPPGA